MKNIILTFGILISISSLASEEMTTLNRFSANSAICKKLITDVMSDDFSACTESFDKTVFKFIGEIQTYPGIPQYSFSKDLQLSGNPSRCTGEIEVSFYESLQWTDGLGNKFDVGDGIIFRVSKLTCL